MPEILCVGRACPDKGILEAAEAIAMLLPDYPGWRARFVLACLDKVGMRSGASVRRVRCA
jgi:glycosyltransferase involved in cell wall biosynthesis